MNILVIKTGALGDVVRTSFIAQALKDKCRRASPRVYWLTDKLAVPLFINNSYVYKTVSTQNKKYLKRFKWDLIINLEEDEENCRFAVDLKPKKITGFFYNFNQGKILPTPTAKEWFDMSAVGEKPYNDLLKERNKKTHRQIMSEIVGIEDYQQYEPFLRLTINQRRFANDFLRRHNLKRTDMIIGINTGAADRWPKQLSVKKTVQLIDGLYKRFNAKILLFGGPSEFERNQKIQKLSRSPIIDPGTGNNLLEFPALISVCNLLITSDSLGMHIALALKRNTIVLVGPTSPSEIDMYGFGEKVIAKSECVACYKKTCRSMEKISVEEILLKVKEMLSKKITLLITAFNEPNISKAIESALCQKTKYNYEVVLSAPDESTLGIARKYAKKHKNMKVIQDPGKGKSFALNYCFDRINTDILILTDGDVYLGENVVEEITSLFLDPEIGCVSGHPIPQESKDTKYGYWAHFLFNSAHKIRKKAFEESSFIECTGYLFAFKKGKIKDIPTDVAEDTVIPYLFWQKGYKIGYAEKAEVFVKNADNWADWLRQKTRTHKSHEKLHLYVDTKTTPKVKTFGNEARGIFWLIRYPKNLQEFLWTKQLIISRLMTWAKYYADTKFAGKRYEDAWDRVESTK